MTIEMIQRVRFSGAPCDVVTMDKALDAVDRKIREGRDGNYVLAMNPEKFFAIEKDPGLARFIDNAFLLIADGIGVVIAVRLLCKIRMGRVVGTDLMERICAVAPERGYRLFIYGGTEEVNRGAIEILRKRHPGIRIVGRSNGFVTPDAMPRLIEQINDLKPDVVFAALGSPRQENWIRAHFSELNARICMGVGGSLDAITGTLKRPPMFLRRLGLEWFCRLVRQPTRAKRQKVLVRFAFRILRAWMFKSEKSDAQKNAG